jgi:uncharacterized protein (TIGR02217 family)
MSFANVRFETGYIIYATEGGPTFSTDIVIVNSGYEQRNKNWQYPKGSWNFGDRKLPDNELTEIVNFFQARGGMAEGFLFKDWADYQVTTANGTLGPVGAGTGLPAYQLTKSYTSGGSIGQRLIQKPINGTLTAYRNGTALTVGAAAGNIAVDYTTGIVTFVPDATQGLSSITVGTTTQFVLATSNLGLVAGKQVYLSGCTGANAAAVNGIAHTITSIAGVGPYTFTVSTNTLGMTISATGGSASAYPQASDVLTFASEFDVPVRFDTDQLKYRFDSADVTSPGVLGRKYFYLSALPLAEIRV